MKTETALETVRTWLPVFPGFYGTLFDYSENAYRWEKSLKEAQLVPDDWSMDVDDSTLRREIAKEACDWLAYCFGGRNSHRFSDLSRFGLEAVTFEELKSPRFYNFENDAVNIAVEIDRAKFAAAFSAYLGEICLGTKTNRDAFADYLHRHYKSRDGFMSFYPHTVEDWEERTNGWKFDGEDDKLGDGAHSLGAVLNFLLFNENDEADLALYYHVAESVYADSYVLNYPADFDHETANRCESFSL